MTARVLVITLDAAETSLLERWAAAGELPAMARVMENATAVRLTNTLRTIPDALWPELYTGIHGHRLGQYFQQSQIHSGEAHLRQYRADEMDLEKHYWSVASRAGKRVAVFDQVLTPAAPDINGIQLVGWGVHNPRFGYHSVPTELCDEIQRRYDRHPVYRADLYRQNYRGLKRLLGDLLKGNARRTELLTDQMNSQSWDLFSCALSEAHCAGHTFWHFHDESHPEHRSDAPDQLKLALRSVYQALDATVAGLIDIAGPETHVVVLATHGMGPFVGGYQLLPEVLVRLGLSSDQGGAKQSLLRQAQSKFRDQIPIHWVAPLQRLGRNSLIQKMQARFGGMVFPLESDRTRAAWIPNNSVGAIRLNLKGREPFGCVQPGREADDLLAELKLEISALVDPDTEQPIVERVVTPAEVFGQDFHPNVPDLMINFRKDLGRLDACYSKRVGLIQMPARNARVPRSGDHAPTSCVWIQGPGVARSTTQPPARMIDVAPTILEFLEVPLPDSIDGRPILFQRVT